MEHHVSLKISSNGNITSKSDIGQYSYSSTTFPHTVTAVDCTGSIPYHDQWVYYNDWGKVDEINYSNGSDYCYYEVEYGPDQERVFSYLASNNDEPCYKIQWGDYEEYHVGDVTEIYYWIEAPDGLAGVLRYTSDDYYNPYQSYVATTDHLGSLTALYDESGSKVHEASYDAWGKRTLGQVSMPLVSRGYTGHEHLDELGLINMNGRLYDCNLGRFLSPDNYIQAPDNPQNYNRYSYCLNNPLKYTDPDGEYWHLIVGGIIGGLTNWISHDCEFSWKGFWYFNVGALAGAASAAVGGGISSSLAGGSFWAGAVGTSSALTAGSSFLNGAAIGGSGGFTSGFIAGTGNGLLSGDNCGKSLINGLREGLIEGTTSALLGGIISGYDAVKDGRRFWDGATVSYEDIYEQNMPIVGQIGNHNCLPASAQSIDNYYGGDMTQEHFRSIMEGDANKDGLLDTEFWKTVSKEYKYKHYGSGKLGKSSFREMEIKLQQRYGVAITLGGSTESHSVVLSGIYRKTVTNLRSVTHYAKYNWYNIMDPAKGGGYRMVNRFSLRGSNFFYIKL